ncbi:MAG: histidine kinase [Bacteroidales bacterium]|nr:histidine kinase [Bacteroidales bacterium]
MYRYLVCNADRHLIPLKDEIRFTENYAALVHYRYDGIRIEIDEAQPSRRRGPASGETYAGRGLYRGQKQHPGTYEQ